MTTTGSIGTSLQMSRILVKNLMSLLIIAPYARIYGVDCGTVSVARAIGATVTPC